MRVKLRGRGRLAFVEPSLLLPVGRLAAVLGQVLRREASAWSTSREDAATRALRTRLRVDAVRDRRGVKAADPRAGGGESKGSHLVVGELEGPADYKTPSAARATLTATRVMHANTSRAHES